MGGEDNVSLPSDDFRRERALLSPSVFFWENGEPGTCPPPDDMIDQAVWKHVMGLPTHVALESSGSAGSVITRLNRLSYGWMCSWPEQEDAPFMAYPTLIAVLPIDLRWRRKTPDTQGPSWTTAACFNNERIVRTGVNLLGAVCVCSLGA